MHSAKALYSVGHDRPAAPTASHSDASQRVHVAVLLDRGCVVGMTADELVVSRRPATGPARSAGGRPASMSTRRRRHAADQDGVDALDPRPVRLQRRRQPAHDLLPLRAARTAAAALSWTRIRCAHGGHRPLTVLTDAKSSWFTLFPSHRKYQHESAPVRQPLARPALGAIGKRSMKDSWQPAVAQALAFSAPSPHKAGSSIPAAATTTAAPGTPTRQAEPDARVAKAASRPTAPRGFQRSSLREG